MYNRLMRKTSVFFVVCLCFLLLGNCFPVHADETSYTVYDLNSSLKEEFSSFETAYRFYNENLENHDNLILKREETVLFMEYGIVEFKTGNACSLNVGYHSQTRDADDYLNGCYAADAAYLSTDRKGENVTFMIADDTGTASIGDVILHPYEELGMLPSVYSVRNGRLMHDIRSQLEYDFYSSSLDLDEAPSGLSEGKTYFSYDGHYFYEDFYRMIDDYRDDSREQSVSSKPYYNYFQYLPHRSLSFYSSAEAEAYLDHLGIDRKLNHYTDHNADNAADEVNRSQLYGEIPAFFIYQNIYGTNAMMLLSSAISESSYGKSYTSYVRNNLYMTSAYENDGEREANRYSDIESSIYSHAKYFISSLYSNHLRSGYAGTFYGNKKAGLNANYSLDPYYGERSAAAYDQLDETMGRKDRNSQCLGIIRDKERVRFYRDIEMDDVLFTLRDINELSFVVHEKTEDYCRISVDASFDEGYLYDYETSMAYVPVSYFDLFLNEEKVADYGLSRIDYDFAGGNFHGYERLSVRFLHPEDAPGLVPQKEGFEFSGYDDNFTAQYRQIISIELLSGPEGPVELGQPLDLKGAFFRIRYPDGTRDIPLTTDMVSGFDPSVSGTQTLDISYCGMHIQKQIEVSEGLADTRQKITEALETEDYEKVRELMKEVRYPFTFSQIREADYALKQEHNRNYVIRDETGRYDLSISGLDLSLEDKQDLSLFGDTYYVIVRPIDPEDAEAIMKVANGYGFTQEEGIAIRFRFNFREIELQGPAIVQLDLEDKKNDKVYTVYHLDEEGDVIKCRTTQSEHFIQFMIEDSGPYLVLSMPSANEFDIRDNTEDLSYENMGFDNHRMNLLLMGLLLIVLTGLIGITSYYIVYHKREKVWKDFKRSLLKEDTVPAEKRNS